MEIKEIDLLKKLENENNWTTSLTLANTFEISESSIKSLIKDLNEYLNNNGAYIQSKKGQGNGYKLIIQDEDIYETFKKELLKKGLSDAQNFSNSNARINYIIERLMQTDTYIKLDDLAEELSISRTQISKDFKSVKNKLNEYGMQIHNKPHYGIKVVADEYMMRQCLAKLKQEQLYESGLTSIYVENSQVNKKLAILKTIIIDECEKYDYTLTDFTCQNLVTHLYVAILRAKQNKDISIKDEQKEKISQCNEYVLAKNILTAISKKLNLKFLDSEVYYCTIHLLGKRTLDFDDSVLDANWLLEVKEMLEVVERYHDINLGDDFELINRLILHMIPLASRMEYKLNLKNPLLTEIRRRYQSAYDIAVTCGKYLYEKHNFVLSDDELSYLAIHFQVSLENQNKHHKNKILLVCSTGRGSAMLLKARLQREFGDKIGELSLCEAYNIEKQNLNAYDYIFSTVPLEIKRKNIIYISTFFDEKDNELIKEKLVKNQSIDDFTKHFEKRLFLSNMQVSTKEEAIKELTDLLNKHYHISKQLYDFVLKREELSNTCYQELLAMPHPYRVLTTDTYIGVGILNKPVQWDENNKVQLIILCVFGKNFAKNNDLFFEQLNKIISSKQTIKRLIKTKDFNDFQEIIIQKLGE